MPAHRTIARPGHLLILLIATGSLAVSTSSFAQLRATLVASGLTRPLGFVPHPTDPAVQLILEQAGRARVLRDGRLEANDFLDLRGQTSGTGEQGLLGLAFAPDYAASGRVFVNFTNLAGHTVIARFTRSASDPLRVDPDSRFDLVWPDGQRLITQPFSNHNGGHLEFGADGFLYIGLGDGGSGNDPGHLAQQPGALLGKMLRIDVAVQASHARGYVVPSSNPFVGRAGVLPEIWAFGLRNPWRWTFDPPRLGGTGAMVIADVGQGAFEEVNYEPAGAGGRNYGWRNREGAHDNVTSVAPFSTPLTDPIFEYGRAAGRSITGGVVYRGSALGAGFSGRYFFADYVTNRIWSMGLVINPTTREATATTPVEHTTELGDAATTPTTFGIDASGEVYVVSYEGRVYRIDGPPAATPPPPPPPLPGNPSTPNTRRRVGPATGRAQGR